MSGGDEVSLHSPRGGRHRGASRRAAELQRLEDERAFAVQSIRDLDAERSAGDLSDEDYEALRSRYTFQAAAVIRALDASSIPPDPASPADGAATEGRRRPGSPATNGAAARARRTLFRRRIAVLGALALAAVAAIVFVVSNTGVRLPGETATGSITTSRAQQITRTLGQAEILESQGQALQALRLYSQVLAMDPHSEEALAESGWLEYQAGVQAKDGALLADGQQRVGEAVRLEPSATAPHLYLGSMYLLEGHPGEAASQYRLFLAGHPPAAQERAARPFITRAFTAIGQPVPPLAAAGS